MAATEKIMVASTLESVAVGEQFDSLPPHMTIFPWFDLEPKDESVFDFGLREVIMQTRAPIVEGGSAQSFVEDNTVAVRRLDRSTESFNLITDFWVHAMVYRLVNKLGADYDPRFVGLEYAPHISDTPERSLAEGERVTLDNLTVFKKDEQRRKLVKAVYLWDKIDG